MRYVSTHHHSTYSYMDGYGRPEEHVARAAELGMGALGLTEHGNVSSHVQLERAALAAGIKPIFGVELYTGGVGEEKRGKFKWHLTVLAESQEGYRNLLELTSRGWREGFYYEPTVSGEMLAEHAEGLIVLSGCSGSKIVCDLLGGKGVPEHEAEVDAALETARRFQELLGDRYYLETQAFPELERTKETNKALEFISGRLGIPLVATGDVHYPKPEDSRMQVILHAAGRGNNSFEKQQQSWGYDVKLSPPLSDEIVIERLIATGLSRRAAQAAVDASATIGERCNVTLPKAERFRFPVPDGDSAEALFRRLIIGGWKYRRINEMVGAERERYKERIRYEMSLMKSKDFIDYFLLLADILAWAKDRGIPVGPGRGSAASSLILYLLRITEVDPMRFPSMVFERFIDHDRVDLPDVDVDVADDRRDELRLYAISKYGEERVGNIGNFVGYKAKNAIDDVGRVHRVPKWKLEKIKEATVERPTGDPRAHDSLSDTEKLFPAIRDIYDEHPELRDAFGLEGGMKTMSVHAAGMVVAPTPLTDICAVYTKASGAGKARRELAVLSVDKNDAEYLGVMKIDLLGLTTMGMVDMVLSMAGITLEDLYRVPLDDPATLRAFRENDVMGIFQFEGRATRLICKDVRPDNFMELADINALSRPGPLHSGVTAKYIAAKHGRVGAETIHPAVDEFTRDTKGQIVYQEQILNIVRHVGGFPVTKVAAIRKVISKKLGEDKFEAMFAEFAEGAERIHGIDVDLSRRIWNMMITASQYSFNVAHAVGYAMLAFWAMHLKVHYPVEFYVASLRKSKSPTAKDSISKRRTEGYRRLLHDARRHDIDILPPDLAESGITWEARRTYDGSLARPAILAGLTQIKGVGEKLAAEIIAKRGEIGRMSWEDVRSVKGVGEKKLSEMRRFADRDDPFELDLARKMLSSCWAARRAGQISVPAPTHLSDDMDGNQDISHVVWWGVPREVRFRDIVDEERARTGEEPDVIKARLKDPHLTEFATLICGDTGREEVYVRVSRWSYPRLRRRLEAIRPNDDVVVVVGSKKSSFGVALQADRILVIDPEI